MSSKESPITIKEDGFHFDTKLMEIGIIYPFEYKGDEYGVKKIDIDGSIELITYETLNSLMDYIKLFYHEACKSWSRDSRNTTNKKARKNYSRRTDVSML